MIFPEFKYIELYHMGLYSHLDDLSRAKRHDEDMKYVQNALGELSLAEAYLQWPWERDYDTLMFSGVTINRFVNCDNHLIGLLNDGYTDELWEKCPYAELFLNPKPPAFDNCCTHTINSWGVNFNFKLEFEPHRHLKRSSVIPNWCHYSQFPLVQNR